MPLLQHPLLGAGPGSTVDLPARVLLGPLVQLSQVDRRTQVVPGGEHRTDATEDHHPDAVVLLGAHERLAELDQQPTVLGVAGLRAVQTDPHDGRIVVLVVGEKSVGVHD